MIVGPRKNEMLGFSWLFDNLILLKAVRVVDVLLKLL